MEHGYRLDFRLPPRKGRELCSSVLLCSKEWEILADVPEQHSGFLTLEDSTNGMSRNVGNKLPLLAA